MANREDPILGVNRSKFAVELRDVSLDYAYRAKKTHALEGVSLAVRPREFVAIVGPSGCGKTTLLKLISGLLLPTAGEVAVVGRELV
ncbi:MAG: ATP-binding cassette domain-containing protein [Candidatus Bipolaricaulota bacterium]